MTEWVTVFGLVVGGLAIVAIWMALVTFGADALAEGHTARGIAMCALAGLMFVAGVTTLIVAVHNDETTVRIEQR